MRIRVYYRVRLRQGPYHSLPPYVRIAFIASDSAPSFIADEYNKRPKLISLSYIDIILFFFLYGRIQRVLDGRRSKNCRGTSFRWIDI